MIVSEKGGASFPQCPTGLQAGRCIGVVDIGTHQDTYEGKSRTRRQVVLMFETPNTLIDDGGEHDGEPFVLSQFYTASLGEKAKLRADLAAWRGRDFTFDELVGFDLRNVLGKPCTLNIVEKGGKSRIQSVLPKQNVEYPAQMSQTYHFTLDDFKQATYDALPDWLKKFIQESPEYKAAKSGKAAQVNVGVVDDDDVPF